MDQNESHERQWNLFDDELQQGPTEAGTGHADDLAELNSGRDTNETVKLRQLELFKRDELHRPEDDRIGS